MIWGIFLMSFKVLKFLIFNYEIEMQRWFREKEGQQNNYKHDWPLRL
jgi:hypothetical protein